jgi:hypothetical protein
MPAYQRPVHLLLVLYTTCIRVSESFRSFRASNNAQFGSKLLKTGRQPRLLPVLAMNSQHNDESGGSNPDLSSSESIMTESTTTASGIFIVESDFQGAGLPRTDLLPEDIPSLLMEALKLNDFPTVDAGLASMWAFAGDTTRHIFEHNITDFIESAHNTANEFSTSFYGNAFYSQSWNIETELNRVGGQDGWIATQVMKTISSDGRVRRWQWELRKIRRPPNLGCWFVESIGSSNRQGNFEPDN